MSTILIVDSDPTEISLLEQMLEDEDFRFLTAARAAEAQEVVRAEGTEINAVLMDWQLADGRGLELLGWMQEQPELGDIEIVVESTEFVPENVKQAIDAGAYYYLTKPFDEPRVEAIVRAAVESCEIKRRLAEKVEEAQDAFRLLHSGRFHLRRIRDAELLAVHISSGWAQPEASVGLLELLVNAVEHGNLEITYEEKGRLLASNRLEEERQHRLQLPKYKSRLVRVDLEQVDSELRITIQDEGQGFDYERFLVLDRGRLFDAHGRGILLASNTLDVTYSPPGNRVSVTLPRQWQ